MSDLAKQVADQCRVIAHCARTIAHVHDDKAAFPYSPDMLDFMGRQTASLMELLGEILNDMDAVDEDEDAWTYPIYREAQRLWPAEPSEAAQVVQQIRDEP